MTVGRSPLVNGGKTDEPSNRFSSTTMSNAHMGPPSTTNSSAGTPMSTSPEPSLPNAANYYLPSRAVSPVSTPSSSRPPSPLLRPFAQLSLGKDELTTQSSMVRKASLKAQPRSRRGSSPAMQPFLAKFQEMDGTGKIEKIAVIGSGSWGTALARLAAINATEKDGFDPTVNMWVRERQVSHRQKSRPS